MGDYAQSRKRMVDNQLRTNDVTDHRILDAMELVPREKFVLPSKRSVAYIDEEVAISDAAPGRKLMRPHVFGKLLQLAQIRPDDVVLLVGGGTGYSSAVLAKLAASVVAVEENADLVSVATENLMELGIDNAAVIEGQLVDGCASEGPYDVIVVDGAVENLPETLLDQLKPDGRLVTVEGRGGAASAMVYQGSDAAVSGRFGFNASVSVLPGFTRAAEFVF